MPELADDLSAPSNAAFTPRELARVGIAATMMVFGGTVVVLLMLAMMGHYNSLAHSFPKAVLDGAVIALLLGKTTRWRCLALLGAVYGLELLIQVGVPYLPPVLMAAGLLGMAAGATAGLAWRWLGVLVAAAVFEWAAGLGAPLKIYFGTGHADEPFLWGMWFAEWPLRIGGAVTGVLLAWRWAAKWDGAAAEAGGEAVSLHVPRRGQDRRVRGVKPAALRLGVLLAATIIPMLLQSWSALLAIAGLVFIYAMVLGPRKTVLPALLGVLWGLGVFMLASYLWHRDTDRVIDLVRTFGLRFAPMAMASAVMIGSVRPVDLVRVLRRCRMPGVVLLPLATVARQVPVARRDVAQGFERLRREGVWTGPWSLFRRPREVLGVLLFRPLQRWAAQLVE